MRRGRAEGKGQGAREGRTQRAEGRRAKGKGQRARGRQNAEGQK